MKERILGINLIDHEKELFGWVYDIRLINNNNKIINVRVDAGTSTITFDWSGDEMRTLLVEDDPSYKNK